MTFPKTMKVHIVSPEHALFSGEAEMLFIRGAMGELGIAPGHLQLLTTIKPGPLRLKHGDLEELLYISGGILEVQPDCVSILADSLERPQDVNEAAVLQAKQAAEALLAGKEPVTDRAKVLQDLTEALAKLQVLELMRLKKKH